MGTTIRCDDCGEHYSIGEWYLCPHGKPTYSIDAYSTPRFDLGLGEMVSSSRDRAAICRRKNLIEKNPPADTPKRQADIRDRQMAKRSLYGGQQ